MVDTHKYWVGVASRDHVKRGEGLGIAQTGHGKKSGLLRMSPGDWIVYYSPYETFVGKEKLQAFTVIGQISDDEIWQADEGDFKPWRRRVDFRPCEECEIRPLLGELSFTAGKNWGMVMRRGLFEIPRADFELIARTMGLDEIAP